MSETDSMIEPGRPEPRSELASEVQMRAEHAGRWVAWTIDERRIVADGDTPEAVRDAAEQAGVARFILDWIPPIDERSAGV
jgi:hypothetical protein